MRTTILDVLSTTREILATALRWFLVLCGVAAAFMIVLAPLILSMTWGREDEDAIEWWRLVVGIGGTAFLLTVAIAISEHFTVDDEGW